MKRLLLGLILVAAPLSAQSSPPLEPKALDYAAGFTTCVDTGHAISFIRSDVVGNEGELIVDLAHEAMHRRQVESAPSCDAFTQVYGTLEGFLVFEGSAYAAGYCAGKRAGLDPVELYDDMLTRFQTAGARRAVSSTQTKTVFDIYIKALGCR